MLMETYLGENRIVSDDPWALLGWREEPRAVGGGYWWPCRLAVPDAVRVHGVDLPFLPYVLVGAKPAQNGLHASTPERWAACKRTTRNQPLVCGPGKSAVPAEVSKRPSHRTCLDMEPVLRRHPVQSGAGPVKLIWGWQRFERRRKHGPTCRVAVWLPADREEEYLAEVAVQRLKARK